MGYVKEAKNAGFTINNLASISQGMEFVNLVMVANFVISKSVTII